MGSKSPEPAPTNPMSIKRGRFDTANSPTMVYVRRKIDHDQQNKLSPSSETPKSSGGESAKELNLEINEEKKEPDLECHETNLESELNELKGVVPDRNEGESAKEPNLGINEEKKEPDLECHETNLESELNELKGAVPNLIEHTEDDSRLNLIGNQIELQSGSELHELKVDESSVSPADVTMDPKLELELHQSEVASPIEVNGEKEPNISPNGEKNEPDLVCHETNLDSDLAELKVIASNQLTSLDRNKEIEPKLDAELQQQDIVFLNQVTNGDHDKILGTKEHNPGSITSNQAMTDSNNRFCERENYRERFAKLQVFLKDCDRSRQDDYIRMLRSLSAVGRSKHAIELENRAMELLMEEGKELRRMNNLHVLGKDWLKDKVSVSAQANFQRHM